MPTALKEDKIQLRINPTDKETLERAAALTGLSTSAFIVSNALRAAKKELTTTGTVTVNKDDGLLLCKLLDNPPKPNTYLKKAVKEYLVQYSGKQSK